MAINEHINVFSVFKNGSIVPIAFSWKNKKIMVDNIHMAYTKWEGSYRIYYYSLQCQDTYYKISIHGKNNICTLHEIEN